MEDTITINKSELQQIVAEEIAKRQFKQKLDFRTVAIEDRDIELINYQHKGILEILKQPFYSPIGNNKVVPKKFNYNGISPIKYELGSTRAIYSRKRDSHNPSGHYYHSKRNLYDSNIHDALKKLTLAVYGATVIKDLDQEEFNDCTEVYNDFKQLFLSKYNQRLYKEEKILQGENN